MGDIELFDDGSVAGKVKVFKTEQSFKQAVSIKYNIEESPDWKVKRLHLRNYVDRSMGVYVTNRLGSGAYEVFIIDHL